MMKPKGEKPGDEGLLEYLEDIIGTNQYVEPIEEKAKALEELNDKRGSQVNRLKIVEKERDALGGAKAEAELFMAKERELLRTRSVLYQLFSREAPTRRRRSNRASPSSRRRSLWSAPSRRRARGADALDAVVKTRRGARGAEEGAGRGDEGVRGVRAEGHPAPRDLKSAKAPRRSSTTSSPRTQEAEGHGGGDGGDRARRADARGEKAEPRRRCRRRRRCSRRCSPRSRRDGARRRAARRAQRALQPWEGKPPTPAAVDVAAAERDLLANQWREAREKLEKAKPGPRRPLLMKTRGRRLRGGGDAERKRRVAERREAAATARRRPRNETQREIRGKLEQRKTAAETERSKGAIVRALMARARVIRGPGRLRPRRRREEVRRRREHRVRALDYVVVETTADAQACVAYLRANNPGVATFLIRRSRRAWRGGCGEPGCAEEPKAPRLMDLIKPASRGWRWRLLRRQGHGGGGRPDAASKIAYEGKTRVRVVTLAGSSSRRGTMSGGGRSPRVGACASATGAGGGGGVAATSARPPSARGRREGTRRRELDVRGGALAAVAAGKEAKEAEAAVAKMERARRLRGGEGGGGAAGSRVAPADLADAGGRRRRTRLSSPG